jgi:hypothetical protein
MLSLRAVGGVAGVAELVDAPDLGSGDESRGGSTPFARTIRARLRKGEEHAERFRGLPFFLVPLDKFSRGDAALRNLTGHSARF